MTTFGWSPTRRVVESTRIRTFSPLLKPTGFSRWLFSHTNSYITKVTVNLAFAVRILAHDKSDETDVILGKISREDENTVIKRDIILAMAQRNVDYWISDRLKYYGSMTTWEKRSLLLASYILGDEGHHWRDKVKAELSEYDKALLGWFSKRFSANNDWGALL